MCPFPLTTLTKVTRQYAVGLPSRQTREQNQINKTHCHFVQVLYLVRKLFKPFQIDRDQHRGDECHDDADRQAVLQHFRAMNGEVEEEMVEEMEVEHFVGRLYESSVHLE